MKRNPIHHILRILMTAVAALFMAFGAPACAAPAPDPGGAAVKPRPVSLDLLAGVCVNTERGSVCYHPLSKEWTLKVAATGKTEALTIVRQDTGSVTLNTASGGTLIYRNGSIEWPAEVDRGK